MKLIFLFLFVSLFTFADALPQATPTPVPATILAPTPVPSPKPLVDTTAVTFVPAGTPSGPATAVATPAAPPTWVQDLLVFAEKIPVVGPIVSKVLMYASILGTILTSLVLALLGIASTLQGVFNVSGLVKVSAALAAFKDSKFLYWLTWFSFLNAKKPADPGIKV